MIPLELGENTLIKIILITILFTSNTYANTAEINQTMASQELILTQLDSVLTMDVEKWIDELNKIDKTTNNYLSSREKECSGEFASLIINEKGEKIYQKKKLTSAEKKHCNYMLVNFRINFNKRIFKIRENYLLKIQKKQSEDLQSLKSKTLTNLERLAQKYK
jgi:hypothetical protein